jgi:hypothetical protein
MGIPLGWWKSNTEYNSACPIGLSVRSEGVAKHQREKIVPRSESIQTCSGIPAKSVWCLCRIAISGDSTKVGKPSWLTTKMRRISIDLLTIPKKNQYGILV